MNTIVLARALTVGIVTTTISAAVVAGPSVEELAQRLEVMQMEMDKLKQQLKNSVSKKEVQHVRASVSAAEEWRQPDTLIHMAGYADVGYTDTESADGS